MANWSRLDDRKNSLRKLIHWRSQSFCHQGMFFASRIKVAKKATKAVKDSSAIAMGVGKGESTTSKASFMVLGMTQATADTEYHANHMGLKHWQNLHPCDFCPADAIEGSNYNFSDFGPAWMQEQVTRDEYGYKMSRYIHVGGHIHSLASQFSAYSMFSTWACCNISWAVMCGPSSMKVDCQEILQVGLRLYLAAL